MQEYLNASSLNVCVLDSTSPKLTCPDHITLYTNSSETVVYWVDPDVTDNVDKHPVITYTKPPGSKFTKGVTTVTVTATDQSQNSDVCAFKVTVNDLTGMTCYDLLYHKYYNLNQDNL